MATVSGDQAIAWMRAHSTNKPGYCLNTIWQAYGSHDSIGPHAGQYPNAIDGWNYATRKNPGDANPPAGVPVFFGVSPTRTDSDAKVGDIVLSLGGGQVIGTDVGGSGRIGVTTIAARARAIARPYLGWTEDFLGYDVVTASTASLAATAIIPPPTTEDDDMLNAIRNYDGSIGFVDDAGLLTVLTELGEWNSYLRLGIVKQHSDGTFWAQQGDGTVWNALARITARVNAQRSGDPKALAQATAALVVPAVLAGLQAAGAAVPTQAQLEAAAETAIRAVFADAAQA